MNPINPIIVVQQKIRECPNCKKAEDKIEVCKNCGYVYKQENESVFEFIFYIIIICIFFWIILF